MKKLCVDVTDELFNRLKSVATHFGHKTHIMRRGIEKEIVELEGKVRSKESKGRVKLPTEVYEE